MSRDEPSLGSGSMSGSGEPVVLFWGTWRGSSELAVHIPAVKYAQALPGSDWLIIYNAEQFQASPCCSLPPCQLEEQRTSTTLSNATSLNTKMWRWNYRALDSCEVWQLIVESLAYNYLEIDNNIVITLRIINTPQDYAEYNLTWRFHEWLL